jgi:hypothetical protein
MKNFLINIVNKIKGKDIVSLSVSPEIIKKRQNSAIYYGLDKKSYNLIIKHETGGERYYNKVLQQPTYPGGQSGVTIGIGYDLGYNTAESFARDWKNKLDAKVFARLHGCLGLKGKTAKEKISSVKDISISWEIALKVFHEKTLPKFIALTKRSFPGSSELHPTAFGALVSLVFNRGGSTKGASRKEMKNIRDALMGNIEVSNIYTYIADQIVAMKRLWTGKGLDGLLRRRDEEAEIIRKCQ